MAFEAREQRVALLLEEWKALAGYVEQGFHILEKQNVFVAAILAAAVGVGIAKDAPVPYQIWFFAPFAILLLLYRLLSQVTFTVFQARRILEIEEEMSQLLDSETTLTKTDASTKPAKCLWYGHTTREYSKTLTKQGAYAYFPWLWLQELLGLAAAGYCTFRAVTDEQSFDQGSVSEWERLFVSGVIAVALLWVYQAVRLAWFYARDGGGAAATETAADTSKTSSASQ